ncbi:MAG: glycosyl transferase [endosymbiont of Galathealinum brachiosum]|uniref:Glycosyl transferase n=1 Tax=endosymbiont of Galathealinum brachiosum TaxID=2200906 RepID=A0A370D8I5_9GAMM|nr:MAG: glycosyl transferase [endosymbiont of Galathealinum brachiosum]
MASKQVVVLGIRGVPAEHGGFETFAEYLCRYLIARDWNILVYCQEKGGGGIYQSEWEGVTRIHIPVDIAGPLGTIIFDWKSVIHSLRQNGVFLTLGYNTAIFNALHRLKGKINIINMDGIEWKRQKWGVVSKAWFWLNERFGCWFGNHLVADHPCIEDHLAVRVSREKITMIAYGGCKITEANESALSEYGLEKNGYAILIARPEPENSILEVVTAFSAIKRSFKLVVLGSYQLEGNAYHRAVVDAASDEVLFVGAIYDSEIISALRFFARVYVHGHQVGGTNPSLVEALGAGGAVIAHDNPFNQWVAKDAAVYFDGISSLEKLFDQFLIDDELVSPLKAAARRNFEANFQWDDILKQYEALLLRYLPEA